MKLTKANISDLTLPTGKRDAIFFDQDLRGFGLRIRAGGKRTWIVQFQLGGHQQRRLTLGSIELFSPDEARKWARERLAEARLGKDPQHERQIAKAQAKFTLSAVIDDYLKAKQPQLRRKSFDDLQRYLRKHWRPLHGQPVDKIGLRDVASRLRELVQESGPIAAIRARGALSALYAWAIGEGVAEHNPVADTNQPAEPKRRERVLTDAELVALWNACDEHDDYGCIVRLLVLTGARRQEVGGMRWSELDPEKGTWTIPSERAKNGRPHALPLAPAAWKIIEGVPKRAGIDHLFGRSANGFVGFQKSKRALDARLSLPHWSAHDLRRTFVTRLSDLGTQPHIVEALINHVSGFRRGVAGTYNRATYAREMRETLLLWSAHINSIVAGEPRKIIPLAR